MAIHMSYELSLVFNFAVDESALPLNMRCLEVQSALAISCYDNFQFY
jgi:hypothetical protein